MTVRSMSIACVLIVISSLRAAVDVSQGVKLGWLDQSPPAVSQGVSFGVPWPQGAIAKETVFSLKDDQGSAIPLQTWPLAFWPDGSIKWSGIAIVADPKMGKSLKLNVAKAETPLSALTINQGDSFIEITNGNTVWRIARHGTDLVDSVTMGKTVVARAGRLVAELEDRSDWETKKTLRVEDFASDVESAAIESAGPMRAVVKIQGKHKSESGDRAWLPFIVRLYFYTGSDSVRMVHTFIFDGDQHKDFIRGLGVRFIVPIREEYQNRHVRIAGDQGFFAEPIRLIAGRRNPGVQLYADQIAGKRIPNLDRLPLARNIGNMAVWDAFKLTQLTPEGFAIQKRTNAQSAWINVTGGNRSIGSAFFGDVSGGLSVDLKNFWQLSPTELEVQGASTDAASLTLWLWSPEAPAMDMRHYDIKAHDLEASYEDVQPGFSNATGVARTSEITFRPYLQVPSDEELLKQTSADQKPALLVCSPEYFHSLGVFGDWSLPDRNSVFKNWIEDRLDRAFDFYKGQVEQRRWYGFWDYGDFMHTYDTPRHEWRYDIGGFAWDNTELVPNLWLWYAFLRSGRADVFRMAEALTRQSQEVDVYHMGPWKGLGSRHNVRHWGDGAKEVRISQALLKRPYYYLTTDERMGDLMDEVIDADQSLINSDPLRELPGISNEHKYPTHVRIGPDWLALVSNWYTAWERTGDPKYRAKIQAGIDSILALPNKIASGQNYGYDPRTSKLYPISVGRGTAQAPSLLSLFGGPEMMAEIDPVLNDPAWTAAWNEFCGLGALRGTDNSRLIAYAAYVNHDSDQAAQAWQQFLTSPGGGTRANMFESHRLSGAGVPEAVDEINFVSTNSTSQWCLNAIELMQLVGDKAPATTQPSNPTQGNENTQQP